jgi:phosphatidylglycerophosphate synthase
MSEPKHHTFAGAAVQRPWDARLARWLVGPLQDSWVTPNHLTSVRLAAGLAAAACFTPGTYLWSNLGAVFLVLSNFLDHTDGELARMSGKTSRVGHLYDLLSDALVTILLFIAISVGVGATSRTAFEVPVTVMGAVAGTAIALIFYLRMRIEDLAGKTATRQASLGGFETEDILYLMPLATLCNALEPLLLAAAVCAPAYASWVVREYRHVVRQPQATSAGSTSEVAR